MAKYYSEMVFNISFCELIELWGNARSLTSRRNILSIQETANSFKPKYYFSNCPDVDMFIRFGNRCVPKFSNLNFLKL